MIRHDKFLIFLCITLVFNNDFLLKLLSLVQIFFFVRIALKNLIVLFGFYLILVFIGIAYLRRNFKLYFLFNEILIRNQWVGSFTWIILKVSIFVFIFYLKFFVIVTNGTGFLRINRITLVIIYAFLRWRLHFRSVHKNLIFLLYLLKFFVQNLRILIIIFILLWV